MLFYYSPSKEKVMLHEMKNFGFSNIYTLNRAIFELFCLVISSSINFSFLKSETQNLNLNYKNNKNHAAEQNS